MGCFLPTLIKITIYSLCPIFRTFVHNTSLFLHVNLTRAHPYLWPRLLLDTLRLIVFEKSLPDSIEKKK